MGKLTTHVLDTSSGKPAQGVKINLYLRRGGEGAGGGGVGAASMLMYSTQTNADGRCEESYEMGAGEDCYQLEFAVDDYFKSNNIYCPFLRDVVIRFYVTDKDENYHVPLLISPFSYSTYRGS